MMRGCVGGLQAPQRVNNASSRSADHLTYFPSTAPQQTSEHRVAFDESSDVVKQRRRLRQNCRSRGKADMC